jgi:hypothetical protein
MMGGALKITSGCNRVTEAFVPKLSLITITVTYKNTIIPTDLKGE